MGKRRGISHHNGSRGISKGNKMQKVMREFYQHRLHSGSKTGKIVTKLAQAKAIGESEMRRRR
jgi:hypothetical protein